MGNYNECNTTCSDICGGTLIFNRLPLFYGAFITFVIVLWVIPSCLKQLYKETHNFIEGGLISNYSLPFFRMLKMYWLWLIAVRAFFFLNNSAMHSVLDSVVMLKKEAEEQYKTKSHSSIIIQLSARYIGRYLDDSIRKNRINESSCAERLIRVEYGTLSWIRPGIEWA